MDVLLVRPPESQMSKFYSKGESLGLGYLAAVLRQNDISVEILDCVLLDLSHSRALEEIRKRDFLLLGFSVFSLAMEETATLIKELKLTGCNAHITLGGHFPTLRAKEILKRYPQVDSIIRYEGEYTLLELIQGIKTRKGYSEISGIAYRDGENIIENRDRPPLTNLDSLPLPARDMLPYALKYGRDIYISTSRGCWGNCTYCSISPFTPKGFNIPKWRFRTAENVVSELEYLLSVYTHKSFAIGDSDFIGPGVQGQKRAEEIADEIIRKKLEIRFAIYTRVDAVTYNLFKKLKKAGLTTVYLGLESGVQAALDRWKKHTTLEQNYKALEICNELGLHVEAGFMLYDPYTTLAEIKQNLRFLQETGIFDFPTLLARMEVRAGTAIEKQLSIEGRLKGDEMTPFYDMIDPLAEEFHGNICQILEPLSPIYLYLRDLKHVNGVSVETIQLIHKRLNIKSLMLALNLLEILENEGEKDILLKVNKLRSQAAAEALRLWKLVCYLETKEHGNKVTFFVEH